MSERTRAADVILAVQAAVREGKRRSDEMMLPVSAFPILDQLRGGESTPIGNLRGNSRTIPFYEGVASLDRAGLIIVDEVTDSVRITPAGLAIVDDPDSGA